MSLGHHDVGPILIGPGQQPQAPAGLAGGFRDAILQVVDAPGADLGSVIKQLQKLLQARMDAMDAVNGGGPEDLNPEAKPAEGGEKRPVPFGADDKKKEKKPMPEEYQALQAENALLKAREESRQLLEAANQAVTADLIESMALLPDKAAREKLVAALPKQIKMVAKPLGTSALQEERDRERDAKRQPANSGKELAQRMKGY